MKIRNLGLVIAALGAAPTAVFAQPSFDVDVDINANVLLPGEPVASVDVFYDQLSPYGVWVDDAELGRVFIPEQAQYVPYTNGHWEYTDIGFVWVSDEPFAWATSHYGRWAYSNAYNRWAWLPDTQWGPAWVEWRETGDYFGWAPLAPDVVINVGYQPPIEAWHYCPAAHITDVNIVNYYVPRERVVAIHREARPIEARATIANRRVIVGPPPAKLREHRIAVKATPINRVDARSVGVLKAAEARAAEDRARERKQVVDEQNRKRIEANAALRDVQQRERVQQQQQRERVQQQQQRERVQQQQQQRERVQQQQQQRERVQQQQQREQEQRERQNVLQQQQREQEQRERQNVLQQQQREQEQRERQNVLQQQRREQEQRERQNVRQQQQREQEQRERQNVLQQQQRERQDTQQQQGERQDRRPTPQQPAQPPRAVQPPPQPPAPRPNEPKQQPRDARPQPKQQPRDARPQPKQQPEKQATRDEPRDHRR